MLELNCFKEKKDIVYSATLKYMRDELDQIIYETERNLSVREKKESIYVKELTALLKIMNEMYDVIERAPKELE